MVAHLTWKDRLIEELSLEELREAFREVTMAHVMATAMLTAKIAGLQKRIDGIGWVTATDGCSQAGR
jgi:hypothetical protein